VDLPDEVAAKILPESAYPNIYFPTSLESFSAAVKEIVEGWSAYMGE
jgi:putative spermidine/putrescine transport system substrate-binding protein